MKKQYSDSVFSKNSITSLSRTLYKMSCDRKISLNAGKLVPLCAPLEIIPGDNIRIETSALMYALSPNLKPIMDKLQVDVYSFFVPKRLLDKNFEYIYCNYKENADYTEDVDLAYAKIQVPKNGFAIHSVADYLGVPPGLGEDKYITALQFRGYVKIWDEWFRPQFLQSSIWNTQIPSSDTIVGCGSIDEDDYPWEVNAIKGGALCPVAKTKDYFTTSLPKPQVGSGELINFGGIAPVSGLLPLSNARYTSTSGSNYSYDPYNVGQIIMDTVTPDVAETSQFNSLNIYRGPNQQFSKNGEVSVGEVVEGSFDTTNSVNKINLVGDTSSRAYSNADIPLEHRLMVDLRDVTGISIREMRWVFQTQLVKEMDLFGNRLFETLNVHFGVVASDSRYQRSEFLGHFRFYVGSYQVTQTSGSSGDNKMGQLSSYMVGRCQDRFLCNKAFPEPGYLYVLACVRIANHTYAEGCPRQYRRFVRFDEMWPAFTTVGDQEVYSDEIWFGASKDSIFGYNTRYSDFKYIADGVAGLMRPTSNGTEVGDLYAFTDYYGKQVYLSADWIWEDKSNIDRTFAVSSEVSGAQFVGEFYFKIDAIRVTMSGQPGLVDHSHRSIW